LNRCILVKTAVEFSKKFPLLFWRFWDRVKNISILIARNMTTI
jgi:hypothetical protein